MRNLFTLLLLAGMSMHSVWGQCTDLFFSEYIEGSSNNKALEIYNPTGASIALSDYVIYRYNNGSVSPTDSLFPTGSVAAYDVYVIGNASADAAILAESDTTHSMTFYNGDDAIALIEISTGDTLDIIGVVGTDPGSSWTVGSGATRDFTLVRQGGVQEGTTDWVLSTSQWDVQPIDAFGFLGSHGSFCDPNFVPVYPIGLVTNDADGDGVGDSVGVSGEFRGVVHGIDLQGGGSIQFTLIDGTGGIGLFSSNDYGYLVTEGDSLHIPGTISQFNGLTQISPDTVILISSGNPLKTPTVITTLDETTESEMIRFESAYLVNPGDWPTSTGSVNFDITNGTDTITLRIDSDTDIDGTPNPPADTFNVTGIGGQFDSSSPYNDGYQMFPRYLTDFEADTAVIFVSGLPIYPIDLVTADNDGDGVGDSLGVACELTGIVHGVDLSGGSSVSFTIIGATGGIGVFSSNNYGYQVQEGDSVIVPGTIGQFNGLTQMNPDTIVVGSSGNPTVTPAVITTLDESTESELIRFNDAYLVDPAQWPTATGSANVDVTNGTDTILVRIDSDTDVDGTPAPADTFDIIGIGGQFDSSSPYNDGYQLIPRYLPDIIQDTTGFMGLPVYPIGLVTADADNDGVGDSLGVACELRGVVYGIDMQGGTNISFTFIDPTGGIGLFSTNDYGYTVTEGDSVHIPCTISQFNGLTQANPDTIIFISSGNALQAPTVITTLDETTESELIQFNNAFLVNPADWPTSTGSVNFDITNGTDTITVRVDSDTDIDGTPAPSGLFNIVGLGGQFDGSSPYLDGYQLLPRSLMDIMEIPSPGVSFNPTSIIASEGDGSVSFGVQLPTALPDTNMVDVSISTSSTATDGADYNNWMDTTLTFPAGSVGPIVLSVDLIDDMDVESDETIIFELSNVMGSAILGDSVLTVTIQDNDYPQYQIGVLTTDNDMDGVGDSLGVVCQVQGIVYGIDYQGGSNTQFTVIDSTGGINIFAFNADFGYTVQEGDEVIVPGEVVVFNGLTEIDPDTIILVSTGNPLTPPAVVTMLDETTESELVKIECLALLDTAQWPTTGGSVNLQATNGVDTFTVRIDSDTDLNGTPPPTKKWLDITGLGGQFDSSNPPLGGYQLLPRYVADVVERPDPSVSFAVSSDTVAEAGGSLDITVSQTDGNPDSTTIVIALDDVASTATNGDDFTFITTTVRLAGCGESSLTISLDIIDDTDFEGDETVVLFINEVSNNAVVGTDTIIVTITDDDAGAISDLLPLSAIKMFPNPTQNLVQFQSDYRMEEISLRNLLGQEVLSRSNVGMDTKLTVNQLPQGVYLVQVKTTEGLWRQKLVIE